MLKTCLYLFHLAKKEPLDFTKWENLRDSLLTGLLPKCSRTKKLNTSGNVTIQSCADKNGML